MQWLIDIIVDMIQHTDYYVDRGDPASADFTIGDFTRDGAWHDLDLSGIIPEGAYAAYIRTTMSGNQANKSFTLREKGNTNAANVFLATTQVANIFVPQLGILKLPSDRIVEYKFEHVSIDQMYMLINGWFHRSF